MKFLLDHDVPEDLSYLLEQLGHDVTLLRRALAHDVSDEAALQFAHKHGCVLLTCNRDDFLDLATKEPHHGIIIVIRRRTRAAERAALLNSSSEQGRPASRTTSTSPNSRHTVRRALRPGVSSSKKLSSEWLPVVDSNHVHGSEGRCPTI